MRTLSERLRCFEHPNYEGEALMQEASDEIERLTRELANARAVDIHSCHAGCTRAGCVNARLTAERDAIEEQAAKNCDEVLRLRERVQRLEKSLHLICASGSEDTYAAGIARAALEATP